MHDVGSILHSYELHLKPMYDWYLSFYYGSFVNMLYLTFRQKGCFVSFATIAGCWILMKFTSGRHVNDKISICFKKNTILIC